MNTENVFDFFIHEDAYPDLDASGAAQRLSVCIRCPSITDTPEDAPFLRIHELIRDSFPHIAAAGQTEALGRSLLITLPGTDNSLQPALFMSHLDVVPVVKGTEEDWTHPPFSGAIEDGYIWGRGALDIKCQVFAILEAAEYLLSHGKCFARTVYFAFGHDEESFNTGSKAISDLLMSRGVRLSFVLDEGGGELLPGSLFGAPDCFVYPIDLMEKGYADLELSVESAGGHSSCPFGGTSLGRLAKAIAAVVDLPLPAQLSPVMRSAFAAMRPYVTEEPLATLLSDLDGNAQAIADYCLSQRKLFPQVITTIAPTVITGSSAACNVMPQNMSAVINFRLAYGQSPEALLELARQAIGDDSVQLRFLQANPPSAVARIDGEGFSALVETLRHSYQNIVFLPYATAGATDAHNYEQICDTCLRCAPFLSPGEDIRRGVHGTDERIAIRSYTQGIRTLIRLFSRTCIE